MSAEVPRRAAYGAGAPSEDHSAPPDHPAPRRSADSPADHEPAPRRSAISPPEAIQHHGPARRSAARSRRRTGNDREWLSIVIAPLVIVLSIGAAIGVRWLVTPTEPDAEPVVTVSPLASEPTESPTASPSPSAAPGQLIELDDASFTAPDGWELVADDLIEDDRRAVRLTETASDARLQAATVAAGQENLNSVCQALVSLQSEAFTDPDAHLSVPAAVPDGGEGLTCGFEGVRAADGQYAVVSFTLLRRDSDDHMLMLRSTVPNNVPDTSSARADLATMQCEASTTFGVPLPLC